ncbi:uncharacterized protein N7483_004994 [Penicillium malachiteum]|uniref:uncharacterized protein n=1 Tax=Penicillium malachiteum TaxID=1324776 RepID=UPI0025495A09|nr:uncharacterized protein N7483_004994 [Penicillium malachiteum]KAJ5730486.1 hypothetical protein N7483_004994 [Penicillium malachiteum]
MDSRHTSQEPMDFTATDYANVEFFPDDNGKLSFAHLIKKTQEALTHLSRIRQNAQNAEIDRFHLLCCLVTQLEGISLNPTLATDKAAGSASPDVDAIPLSVQRVMESLNMTSFDSESMRNALRYLLQQAQSDIREAAAKRSDIDSAALAKLSEIIWESVEEQPKEETPKEETPLIHQYESEW